MFKLLGFVAVVWLVIEMVPSIKIAVAWVLAFFSLLMLGDLLLSQVRKFRSDTR